MQKNKKINIEFLEKIINYLKTIPDEKWIVEKVRDENSRGCVMSHIFDYGEKYNYGGSDMWDLFEECFATTFMIYPVNDGENPKYKQKTPKARCLKYLNNMLIGKEKTTSELLEEYEKKMLK